MTHSKFYCLCIYCVIIYAMFASRSPVHSAARLKAASAMTAGWKPFPAFSMAIRSQGRTNPCIMNTYAECVCKSFLINTYETKDLKLPRINTYKKNRGEGSSAVSPVRGVRAVRRSGVIMVTFPERFEREAPDNWRCGILQKLTIFFSYRCSQLRSLFCSLKKLNRLAFIPLRTLSKKTSG